MSEWFDRLKAEFASRRVMGEFFPMLTQHGLEDTDVAIHSHMLSYLACVGQQLGFSGIAECPLPSSNDLRLAALGEVRADVLWVDRQTNSPVVAFEFERFQTKNDEVQLRRKIENLAITSLRSSGSLQHCFLIYWLRSGTSPQNLRDQRSTYQHGFVRNGVQVPPPNCPLTIAKCVFSRRNQRGMIISDLFLLEDRQGAWSL
ncbi:MAG: hypothetical protein PHQ40_00785 [Anaerolineaceae bacterium]|nr:hypothetical protein [Anaerolineaceae bacterium]